MHHSHNRSNSLNHRSDVAMELYGMVSEHRRAVEASPRRAEGTGPVVPY